MSLPVLFPRAALCFGAALLLIASTPVQAATKTWTGGGITANWSTAANWNPSGGPANGDALVFPASASRLINTNNLVSLRVASVTVTGDGYSLRGNSLMVSNGMVFSYSSGVVSVFLDVALGTNQVFDNRGPFTSFAGDINLNGFNLTADGQDAGELFVLNGAISGSGNVIITGAGEVTFQGSLPNTYTGTTTVNGRLTLGKAAGVNAVPQALIVPEGGEVAWINSNQVPDGSPITVVGSLDLADEDETVASLDLQGASIVTGAGVLTLNGGVTNRASATGSIIVGTLHLGQFTRSFVVEDGPIAFDLLIAANIRGGLFGLQSFAGINKLGEGTLVLSSSNSFGGPLTVQAGELRALNNDSLGTTVGGTSVSSNASLVVGNLLSIAEPLSLAGQGVGGTNGALRQLSGTTADNAAIALNGPTLIVVENGGTLSLNGVISGPGPLMKDGAGDFYLSGASGNSFTGGAVVEAGAMYLNKSVGNAIPGDAAVGAAGFTLGPSTPALLRQLRGEQIGGSVTVNGNGTWDLNNQDEDILDLFLNGHATVTTGNGRLSMRHITATPDPSLGGGPQIAGFVNLSPAEHTITVPEGVGSDPAELEISASVIGVGGFTKTGSGDLWLTSSNTFLGVATVNQGELRVGKDLALGSTFSGTRVLGSGVLSFIQKIGSINFGGVRVSNEVLEVSSVGESDKGALHCSDRVAIWSGQVTLNQTTVINTTIDPNSQDLANLRLDGNVSGPGGIVKTGPGRLAFINFGVNDYAGATVVNEGTVSVARVTSGGGIPGPLVVGDGSGNVASAVVELGINSGVYFNQIRADQPVTVNSDGLLRFQVRAPTSLSSLAGSGRLEILEADQVTLGAGDSSYTFDGSISGPGKLVKTGGGTVTLNGNNTLTGDTMASAGKLIIKGIHSGGRVLVDTIGQLGGNGQLGEVIAFPNTRLAPGTSPGRLTANSVVLWPNSVLELECNGPAAGTDYNQLRVLGSSSVSNAILRVSMKGFPTNGQVFTILDKLGAGPVLGTFANGGEGSLLNIDGFEVVLSYVGGDGNDVTLTVTNRFWQFESAVVTMGNGNGLIDRNECNHLKVNIRNVWTGLGISAGNIRLDSDTPGIVITSQEWSNGISQPGSLLTNTKPIQFRTAPDLPCGTWADFSLTLTTGSPLRIPFRIFIPPTCTDAGGGCDSCNGPIAGVLGANQMPQRLHLSGDAPSLCGWAKLFPGTNSGAGPFRYNPHWFTNTGPATCISVLLKSSCANSNSALMASAYTNFFDPGNIRTNYAGDTAMPNALDGQFAFRVTSNQVFAVVVNDIQPAASSTCSSYTLEVFGLPCPAPRLDIEQSEDPNKVRLQWSTAYPQHQLERAATLALPTTFTAVTNGPTVQSGKYRVTDTSTGPQGNYRLRKP